MRRLVNVFAYVLLLIVFFIGFFQMRYPKMKALEILSRYSEGRLDIKGLSEVSAFEGIYEGAVFKPILDFRAGNPVFVIPDYYFEEYKIAKNTFRALGRKVKFIHYYKGLGDCYIYLYNLAGDPLAKNRVEFILRRYIDYVNSVFSREYVVAARDLTELGLSEDECDSIVYIPIPESLSYLIDPSLLNLCCEKICIVEEI